MLIQRRVTGVSGIQPQDAPYVNYGEMLNTGWEFFAEYRNQEHALKYRIGANLTTIKNEITQLGDPIQEGYFRTLVASQTAEGRSVGEFYGYQVEGIFQTREEVAAHATQATGTAPGDFKFADLNNDGVINASDRTYLGSPLPKFTYGFNVNLEYKGLDLGIFFQGSQGNKIMNGAKYDIESGLTNSNFTAAMLNRWTGAGTSNEIPRITTSDPNDNRRMSSYYIEDGSYLRLKNLQLGYSLPETISKKFFVQKLRIFIAGQNLLTFTKYTGLDPEIGQFNYATNGRAVPSPLDLGIDRGGTYPQARTYQLGLNVTF